MKKTILHFIDSAEKDKINKIDIFKIIRDYNS